MKLVIDWELLPWSGRQRPRIVNLASQLHRNWYRLQSYMPMVAQICKKGTFGVYPPRLADGADAQLHWQAPWGSFQCAVYLRRTISDLPKRYR
jgi:hypothetical protein